MLFPERYVITWRKPDGTRVVSEPLRLRHAIGTLRHLAVVRGADTFYFDSGDGFGDPRRDLDRALRRVKEVIRKQSTGDRSTFMGYDDDKDDQVLKARIFVTELAPEPDTSHPGTPQTQRWMGIVKMFWPDARFAGSVVCKPDSDHALGAAVDYFDTWEHMEAMHEQAILDDDTKYSILKDEIWTAGPPWTTSSRGRHDYTGAYHYHHHRSSKDGKRGVYCLDGPGYGR